MKKLSVLFILSVLLFAAPAAHAVDRTLSWQDNSNNETGFIVQSCVGACTNASVWAQIGQVTANINTFKVLGVAPGSTTSYRVLGYDLAGMSPPSNIATDVIPMSPSGPTNLTIRPCSSIQATADVTGSIWTITCVP